jgi:ribosome-associated translation inhibitor RaiA
VGNTKSQVKSSEKSAVKSAVKSTIKSPVKSPAKSAAKSSLKSGTKSDLQTKENLSEKISKKLSKKRGDEASNAAVLKPIEKAVSQKKQTQVTKNMGSTPEVRAFIYQQLNDLEHLLPVGSSVSVSVMPEKKSTFMAQIEVIGPAGTLHSTAIHKDEYSAIVAAKHDLKSQLEFWFNVSADDDRDFVRSAILDAIKNKHYLN